MIKKILITILLLLLAGCSNTNTDEVKNIENSVLGVGEGIALDATSYGNNGPGFDTTTATWSHTCSGDNRILMVFVYGHTEDVTTGVTYNGDALTLINKVMDNYRWLYLYYLVAPDTGTHNIVVTNSTGSGILGMAASYTDVNQTSPIDNSAIGDNATGASLTTNITTTADNAWLVGGGTAAYGGIAAGANTTLRRTNGVNTGSALFDSNGAKTPAGSYSLIITASGGNLGNSMVMASLSPYISIEPTETIDEAYIINYR